MSKNVLSLEDTSTLSYRHNVTQELGFTGASKTGKAKGLLAHSVLMVNAQTEQTIGLAEQQRWCRKDEDFATKHQRFVVRAKHKRIVTSNGDKLTPYINHQSSALSYQVKIQQKCDRKARIANIAVRFASATIFPPKKQVKSEAININVN